ncbi:LytTR family DNA-binding domain-containing protein [Amycolatopsis sp.]|uniref:LytR/AlgR family response regulator transcription factor n=1 Tax=Amycolatopsis sp. TaxID=37632 RepID=UPI002C9CCD5F|nr:LytTR family DNA-binding domain-containing protein [Amycolatopsis sp.]HVV11818.1 LytTR family DNA-binding domain-containing protein [Amycolatopsis sp.]
MSLRVLAVDDVPPALDELTRMLKGAPEVGEVTSLGDPLAAVKSLLAGGFDAAFLDIAMPGLDGLELAGLLSRLAKPPAIVFVTAYNEHAVSAFGVGAVDYVLKPIRAERLAAALTKVNRMVLALRAEADGVVPSTVDTMTALAVESDGRTSYVHRDDVQFVEAHGDYVRLHTRHGVHEVRMPMARLEEYWEDCGFVRIHRGFLVALHAVRELRSDSVGGVLAHTGAGDVPVSRRHARELRERLLRAAQRGELGR